jgi:hypothetical protein
MVLLALFVKPAARRVQLATGIGGLVGFGSVYHINNSGIPIPQPYERKGGRFNTPGAI